MKILRDVREATKLLILRELTTHRHSRLRTLAEKLDITIQGVSEYMKLMTKDGLVRNVDGEWRATRKGVELLQADFIALRDFVESSIKGMDIVDTCKAIAGENVREGEGVGLFMETGDLVAYPGRDSSSKGTAAHSASKGEVLAVRELEGIVRLHPGKITIFRIPSARGTHARRFDVRKAGKLLKRIEVDVVATSDLAGRVLARKVGLDVDISFSVLPAALEAAQRGLNVLVLCPEDRVAEFIGGIEESNAALEDKIAYETLSLR